MKRILAMVICVALLATMAITGSIAYLQDTDSTINTMVVGNVDIDQIEQQRKADDTLVDFDNDKPLYPAVYGNGTNSDGTTSRGEAQKGTDGFWSNVAGAQDKIVSVKNTGKSEAYVRTWFAFEADANDKLEYIDINWNENVNPVLYTEEGNSYVTIDGNNYVVYCVTYPAPLAVGATSEKSLLQVHMKPEADNEYVAAFDETYDILVFTQAGQVENMSTDPKTALDFMFGAEHPWNDEDFKVETGRIVIRTAADLQALSEKSLTTDTKIVLANDIDMDGAELKTIHVGNHSYGAKVKFDGGNHTISNVKLIPGVDVDNSANGMKNIGLFSLNCQTASELTVENLTLKMVTVVGVDGVNDSDNDETKGAAAVVGYVNNENKVTLKNVTVCDSTITNDAGDAAGLVGMTYGETNLINCKVYDCNITGEHASKKDGRTYNEKVTVDPEGKTNKSAAFVSTLTSNATVTIDNDCVNGTSLPDWFCNALQSSASITGSAKQVITIGTAAALKAFADSVNNGTKGYSEKTVMLTADIDLSSYSNWTPIGQFTNENKDVKQAFYGTFDGDGHTISNLTVDTTAYGGNYAAGLFGASEGMTVKNLTINGASVTGHHFCGAIIGNLSNAEGMEASAIINCKVMSATISSTAKDGDSEATGDKAGAIAGKVAEGATMNGCSASSSNVSAARDAGQVVGAANPSAVIGCSATNVTVTGSGNNIRNEVIGRELT